MSARFCAALNFLMIVPISIYLFFSFFPANSPGLVLSIILYFIAALWYVLSCAGVIKKRLGPMMNFFYCSLLTTGTIAPAAGHFPDSDWRSWILIVVISINILLLIVGAKSYVKEIKTKSKAQEDFLDWVNMFIGFFDFPPLKPKN